MKFMRTLALSALTLLSGGMAASGATGGDAAGSTVDLIRKQITLPPAETKGDQKVEVLFTTQEQGKVNFALAKTSDPVLKEAVEHEFMNLKLAALKEEVVYSVVLIIKTI